MHHDHMRSMKGESNVWTMGFEVRNMSKELSSSVVLICTDKVSACASTVLLDYCIVISSHIASAVSWNHGDIRVTYLHHQLDVKIAQGMSAFYQSAYIHLETYQKDQHITRSPHPNLVWTNTRLNQSKNHSVANMRPQFPYDRSLAQPPSRDGYTR